MPSASRRIAAAPRAARSRAARSDFRGPDPFDGLWWRWPGALVGGRRRRQALIAAARALAGRRAPALSPPPSADRQGARGLRLGRGARAHRSRGAAAPRARPARPASSSTPTARRAARLGLPVGRADAVELLPGGHPQRRRRPPSRPAGCSRRRASWARRPRRARAVPPRAGSLDELWVEPEGYFAYHAGPTREHPQRQPPRRVAGPRRRRTAPRPASASQRAVRADARRPAPRWVVALRRGRRTSAGRTRFTPATCCCAWIGCAPWIAPRSARRCARRRALPRRSSTPPGARGSGPHKPFPEDAHSAGTGLSTLGALVRRGLVERELLERVARRVLEHGLRDGHAVHRRYRWGATTVRYLRWCDAHVALGLVDAAAALRGVERSRAHAPSGPDRASLRTRRRIACARRSRRSVRRRRSPSPIGPPWGTSLKPPPTVGGHLDEVAVVANRRCDVRSTLRGLHRHARCAPTRSRGRSDL